MTPSPPTRRSLIVPIVLGSAVLVAGVIGVLLYVTDKSPGAGWVRVGSVQDVRAEGVVWRPDLRAYVVMDPPKTPIALLAVSPHLGERVVYCPSSTWFEEQAHGSKFDRVGNYVLGPAARGLDRLPTIVRDGMVWVNPSVVMLGPPRGRHEARPAGPFCSGND
jgi:phenylpropionate dioxygenase-like ring-hydroxylating dioxygenase large terminal subunit